MKTIVYQSYRTAEVEVWMDQCMQSVRYWADLKGYDYKFYDDILFSYVPEWFKEKVNHKILPISDLARLLICKELLLEGYDRVIWVDADMLIFQPNELNIDTSFSFAFCYEIWLETVGSNPIVPMQRVNNSLTVFCKNNSFLDFYISACEEMVKKRTKIGPWFVGTRFLTHLRQIYPYDLIYDVAMASPILLSALLNERQDVLELFQGKQVKSANGINLCRSLANKNYNGIKLYDADYQRAVDLLLHRKSI